MEVLNFSAETESDENFAGEGGLTVAVILIQTSASRKVKFKCEKVSMIVALKKKNL